MRLPRLLPRRSSWPLLSGVLLLALSVTACSEGKPKMWSERPITQDYTFPTRGGDGEVVPAGLTVTASQLNKGRHMYIHYCYACHGMDGDGDGPAAQGLRPPPRDFRVGAFKFGAVRSGELPNDDDFIRIIKGGLHGTAMLPWDVTDGELVYIVHYIKTFPQATCDVAVQGQDKCDQENALIAAAKAAGSVEALPDDVKGKWGWGALAADWSWGLPSRWTERYPVGHRKAGELRRETGKPVVVPRDAQGKFADPWAGKIDQALTKGREIYHLSAQCANCHPAYVPKKELFDLSVEAGSPLEGFREGLYDAIVLPAKDNPYRVNIVPPDFTRNPLRSIRPGHETEDLYRLIASGVGGVMPQWVDGLTPEQIWALTHYVNHLYNLTRSTNRAAAKELHDRLLKQEPFSIPKKAPEPPPAPPSEEAAPDEADEEGQAAPEEGKAAPEEGKAAPEQGKAAPPEAPKAPGN